MQILISDCTNRIIISLIFMLHSYMLRCLMLIYYANSRVVNADKAAIGNCSGIFAIFRIIQFSREKKAHDLCSRISCLL